MAPGTNKLRPGCLQATAQQGAMNDAFVQLVRQKYWIEDCLTTTPCGRAELRLADVTATAMRPVDTGDARYVQGLSWNPARIGTRSGTL